MNKKGKTSGVNIILLIAAIVLAYLVLFPSTLPWNKPTTTTGAPGVVTTVCPVDRVAFAPKMTKKGEAGTSASDQYFIITDKMGLKNSSASVNVPTAYKMKILFGDTSTTYYTVLKDVDTGCTGELPQAIELGLADTSLNTFYLKNGNGQVNDAGTPQPMSASDTFEATIYIKAGIDSYFGDPDSSCKDLGVAEYDKTYFKSIEGQNVAPIPRDFSYNNSDYDGSAAFYIPKTGDGKEESFEVVIKSTTTDPDGTNEPIIHVYDCNIGLNAKDLSVVEGVEDVDGNLLSLVPQELVVYIS